MLIFRLAKQSFKLPPLEVSRLSISFVIGKRPNEVVGVDSKSRIRPDLEQTTEKLLSLGATHVLTYDQLSDRLIRDKIKSWTDGKVKMWS